ncbi:hypothetical protein MFUL124B02_29100 [Myxococcus fulvus 124B02]|nr:hypothetical protein MFUL124B02_29100 [Myxococcus fulvus 124B02]
MVSGLTVVEIQSLLTMQPLLLTVWPMSALSSS